MILHGSITISRRLREHLVWQRPDYGWAWVDLLLLANNRAGTKFLNGEFITIERGQLLWSLRSLENEWHKSGEWLTAFIKFCKDQAMVKVDSNRRRTIISILNYDAYNPPALDTETVTLTGGEPDTETVTLTEQKGEGRTGNEKGERATPPKTQEFQGFSEVPSEPEVLAFAGEYAGDLVRGIPAHIPPRWASDWLRYKSANLPAFPKKWREKMAVDFRNDWVAGHPKARDTKNAAVQTGGRSPAQARFELSRELEKVQGRLDAVHETSLQPSPADKKREKDLKKLIKELPE